MTEPLEERFAADAQALRVLRRRARSLLQALGLPALDVEAVVLVLDELVSNAIEHGASYRRREKPLHLRLRVDGADLLLEFGDDDMPPEQIAVLARTLTSDVELPDLEDERGRGLFLVLTSLHAIEVEDRTAQGSGLLLRGRFPGVAPA